MSKKLVVWALALSLGFGSLTASVFAADEPKKEPAKTEVKKEESCTKVKKKKSCHGTKKKIAPKGEEIPTEPSPDAKTPERK